MRWTTFIVIRSKGTHYGVVTFFNRWPNRYKVLSMDNLLRLFCVCSISIFNSIVNLRGIWAAPANSKHCTFGFRHTNHRSYNEWPEKIVYLSEISSGNGLQGGFLTLRQLRNQFADCYYNYTIATHILLHGVISKFDDCQSTNLNIIITICRKGFPLRLI